LGRLCAQCEHAARDKLIVPPQVPPEFWQTEQFRAAFAAQHIGWMARTYRTHPYHQAVYGTNGISQTLLGHWLGLRQPQVSRIETGPPIRDLDTLVHWARVLGIPAGLLWFRLPGEPPPVVRQPAPDCTTAIPFAALQQTGPLRLVPMNTDVLSTNTQDAAAMRAFRSADMQVGGGHLYASVLNYLQTEVGPRLFSGDNNTESATVFTAAAALTEMAGWMAHDAGRDEAAKRHFGRSFALVQVGGDHQLGAHVLGSLSHLANHLSQPDEAIAFARQGQAVLQNAVPHSALEARLFAMEARGLAGRQQSKECIQLLIRAEKALDASPSEPPSPWTSRFDRASLASETARCMRQLGDWAEAQRQAEQIVRLRSSNRTRSRAFAQLTLVAALIEGQQPDEACSIAQEVLDSTQSLGSYLVIEQLLELQRLLQPHHANRIVGQFLTCLEEALRQRQWLSQWLVKDQRRFTSSSEMPP
jgi:tetratricopeptide (TPR) repeat protein